MNWKVLLIRLGLVLMVTTMLTACSFSKVVRIVGQVGTVLRAVEIVYSWFPPAADLATFDAANLGQSIQLQNMALASNSGIAFITIKDEHTGAILGANSFDFSILGGTEISVHNAPALTNWVRSFSTYQGGQGFIEIVVETSFDVQPPPAGQTGTASSSLTYNNVPLASGSGSYTAGPGGGGCEQWSCVVQ